LALLTTRVLQSETVKLLFGGYLCTVFYLLN
jgi:hypothetical protein